jgi:hypothetical protein
MVKKQKVKKMTEEEAPKMSNELREEANMILCRANGCKCTICGGFFAPCEDICGLGQHQIGQYYYP